MFKVGDKVRINSSKTVYEIITLLGIQKEFAVLSSVETGITYPIQVYTAALEHVKDAAKNTFTIKQGQIEAAARFVVANNKYKPYQNVEQAINHINRTIKSMIERINRGEDAWYTSTAGWVIMVSKEDENYYVVEVLVSPDVSVDEEFVNVEEII